MWPDGETFIVNHFLTPTRWSGVERMIAPMSRGGFRPTCLNRFIEETRLEVWSACR